MIDIVCPSFKKLCRFPFNINIHSQNDNIGQVVHYSPQLLSLIFKQSCEVLVNFAATQKNEQALNPHSQFKPSNCFAQSFGLFIKHTMELVYLKQISDIMQSQIN